jgi:hypothetical protein
MICFSIFSSTSSLQGALPVDNSEVRLAIKFMDLALTKQTETREQKGLIQLPLAMY